MEGCADKLEEGRREAEVNREREGERERGWVREENTFLCLSTRLFVLGKQLKRLFRVTGR